MLAASTHIPPELDDRIAELHVAVPLVGARLRDETWFPGSPPVVEHVQGEPLDDPRTARRFDLANDPPLRITASESGRLVVSGHHAAFDGLALVAVLRFLLGGETPQPVASPPAGEPVPPWGALRRLLRPAQAVPPSDPRPHDESTSVVPLTVRGAGTTARLAAACAGAVSSFAAERGSTVARIGITLAVGGPAGVGNVASYRRIDVRPGDPVADIAAAALAEAVEPTEQVRSPRAMRLLAPVVERFSDTVLVSNLGRHELPEASRIDFLPVARGRSAVAFGAAGLTTGGSTLSVRARDLTPSDAARLLHLAVAAYDAMP
jgi:hypothetical protein